MGGWGEISKIPKRNIYTQKLECIHFVKYRPFTEASVSDKRYYVSDESIEQTKI